jgi:hypothetical protein
VSIKRAKATEPDTVIGVLSEGFEMEFPWGPVIMRGCDQQAIPPQWTGVVKTGEGGAAIVADIEEIHGKDLIKSCDEVAQLRGAAATNK